MLERSRRPSSCNNLGYIFCTEDAGRILSSDSSCPLFEQILSKSHMKSVDLNHNDEWVNVTCWFKFLFPSGQSLKAMNMNVFDILRLPSQASLHRYTCLREANKYNK